ncbi:MAG TPA: histidine kinase [Solirubrobacteraceae bacterium]
MATTLSTPPSPRLHRFSGRTLGAGAVQRLLARVGDHAAGNLADLNARLEADRRATLRELRTSRQRTVQAVEEERRRLERDLHDGAQQRLIALRIHLALAAERIAQEPHAGPHVLNQLAQEAQQALDELRRLLQHPYPPLLMQQGLASALRAAVAESPTGAPAGAETPTGAPAHTSLHAEDLPRYHPDVEAAVYFTCLEALQNASKHAGPQTAVAIRLYTRPGQLCFEVSDTGPGFHLAPTHDSRGGLANMRDRIGAIDGEISILSTPAHGTTVVGSVPSAQITA